MTSDIDLSLTQRFTLIISQAFPSILDLLTRYSFLTSVDDLYRENCFTTWKIGLNISSEKNSYSNSKCIMG